jgi:hypothetical protein
MFTSVTQGKCSDLHDRLGVPLDLGLQRDLPAPYQALLDCAHLESVNVSWLPLVEQLKLAGAICVAFGMYDAHDLYKNKVMALDSMFNSHKPWHQQVVAVLDNVLNTQRRSSNFDEYKRALTTLRDESVAMPETSEGVKSLRYAEFHQRQDGMEDQCRDFLGMLAQAGLLDALQVIGK